MKFQIGLVYPVKNPRFLLLMRYIWNDGIYKP